jgi:SAM-dependent methyltransferase
MNTQTTPTPTELKDLVRGKYTEIVETQGSCCGSSCCGTEAVPVDLADDYTTLEGYVPEADYGLGCGLPTEHAAIRPGDTVLDLGSGAGNDAFVARSLVGETGRVIGVDMTPAMIQRARANADRIGARNVEFRLGDIEALPVDDGEVDVIVSNCVLNLVPNKAMAFEEMFRALRPGGHFCVSDIVSRGELPAAVRGVAELHAGCVAGAIDREAYVRMLEDAGFAEVRVVEEKIVDVPDDALEGIVDLDVVRAYRESGGALLSVTVVGWKPGE